MTCDPVVVSTTYFAACVDRLICKRLEGVLGSVIVSDVPTERERYDVATALAEVHLPTSPQAPPPDPLREGLLGLDEVALIALCGEQRDDFRACVAGHRSERLRERVNALQAVLALIAKAKEGG